MKRIVRFIFLTIVISLCLSVFATAEEYTYEEQTYESQWNF